MTIEEMDKRLGELNEEALEIQALADVEKRELTDEEQDKLKERLDEYKRVENQKELRQQLEAQTARLKEGPEGGGDGRVTTADKPGRRAGEPGDTVDQRHVRVSDRSDRDPKWGWRSFGDYAIAVRHGSMKGATPDDRLTRRALSTYSSEGVGADGGFAVPPDFKKEIVGILTDEESLLAKTDKLVSSSNQFVVPTDETTPWGTTGVIPYWEGEAASLTQSKMALTQKTLRLNKMSVLVPVTEELREDGVALDTYLVRKSAEAMASKIDTAIVGGNGVGQPLGIINAPCTVSVAKEGGQTADTIVAENVEKMWIRCYAKWRSRSVWLVNQDCEAQLMAMYKSPGTLTDWPVYLPQGGFAASPFATLFGRPIIYTQACETLGDLGDIILADLKQYLIVTKVGGVRSDVSIHLWFDQDTAAYRFIWRVAGQPWWGAAMDARDGSATYSPFVTLAERA